jgi:hypothetical protein
VLISLKIEKMKKLAKRLFTNSYVWLTLIIIFGFVVRLYKINTPLADWHSWRQVDTASVTRIYLERGIDVLHPRYYDVSSIQTGYFNPEGYRMVELPIFNLLHVALIKVMPSLSIEVSGRLVSVFSSLVTAYFLFLLGRKYISKLGGLLSALFYLFLPYNIYFTRVVLPEPLATTFSVVGIWFFTEWIDKDKDWYLYFSGLWLALSLLIKPYFAVFLVPLIYLAIKKYSLKRIFGNGKLVIKAFIFLDIVLVPLILWRAWINMYPQGIPFFEWAFNGDHIRFRPAFWRWIFTERLVKLILSSWGLPLFFLGLIRKYLKNNFILFYLLGMFLYVSIVATANVRHDYYQIFTVPAIALAVAAGGDYLLKNKLFNLVVAYFGFGFIVLMLLATGIYQDKDLYNINHPEIIRAGEAVRRLTPINARVIAPYNGDTAFLYQTDRFGWPAVDTGFDKLIKFRGADYYVSVNKGDADTKLIVSKYKVIEETSEYVIADLHQPLGGVQK